MSTVSRGEQAQADGLMDAWRISQATSMHDTSRRGVQVVAACCCERRSHHRAVTYARLPIITHPVASGRRQEASTESSTSCFASRSTQTTHCSAALSRAAADPRLHSPAPPHERRVVWCVTAVTHALHRDTLQPSRLSGLLWAGRRHEVIS